MEIEVHVEKGVHQAHQAKMVMMVSQAFLAPLDLLAPLVLAETLLPSLMEKELEVALDQWV